MSDGNITGHRLSRRKMLGLALSGTAVGLAGCSGSESNENGTSSDGSGTAASSSGNGTGGGPQGMDGNSNQQELSPDQMAESVVDMNVEWLPTDANWNHRSNGPASWFWPFDYTAPKYWNGTTDWWLLKENGYNYDSKTKTVTYEFRPEYSYWWNGDPVTAEDLQIQNEIDRLIDPEGSPWKSWTVDGKYTLKGKRKEKINPVLLSPNAGRVLEYRGAYRQWLEKFKADTTDKAREKTLQNLTNWEISSKRFANDGLGNGTYKLDDWSTTQITWKRFDKHPYADQAPFETVKWHVGSGSAANQQITNDVIDVGIGQFEQELKAASPDYLKTVYTKRSVQVRNLLFNYKRKHIARRNVRRALISILDFTRLVDFWNGEGGPVKQRQTGLPQVLEDKWLGDKLINKMVNYPLKRDEKQAKQFMKKAGYEKQGGTWVGPDGDPLKFTFMIGTYLTSEALGKAIAQTWNQWGADAKLLPVSNSQWTGKIFNPQGDWDVTIFLHGFDDINPLNYFKYTNPYHMRLQTSSGGLEKWLKQGKTHSPVNGKPLKPTIPSNPNLEVGSDGGKQINLYKLINELKVTQSKQRSREIIRLLSRYFNYDLPMFDMFPQVAATWGDTKNFDWPKDADTWYQKASRATYATLRKGLVKPVQKK